MTFTKYSLCGIPIFVIFILLSLPACEAPAGPEGPEGEQGPAGPVGPAGEDGSAIYADEGEPADDIGKEGDYYLDQITGELYGPKDSGGWGEPIIVLMGENGQDGADGQDGEDGSQIYSGTGAPDASLGKVGDYYLDKDSYELYGPKTSNGWGTPLNLKGADGNANVTRYIYLGHDFASMASVFRYLDGLESLQEMRQSAWLAYLVFEQNDGTLVYYSIPGYGYGSLTDYRLSHRWYDNNNRVGFNFAVADGPGEEYAQIEIIRIETSDTIDNSDNMAKQMGSNLPRHIDTSNYHEVAEYYGFYRDKNGVTPTETKR